jgi:hypothetical protein
MPLRIRLAFALTLSLGAVAPRFAWATPPSPPIDFVLSVQPGNGSGGPVPFSVEVVPLIPGASLTIEVDPATDVQVSGGLLRRTLTSPQAFARTRLDFAARLPRGLLRRVYVRATLVTADGARYTRGENLALLDGPRLDPEPQFRLVDDGRGGRLAAYDVSQPSAPVLHRALGGGTWLATGQFLYKDREQDLSGFTGNEPSLPARYVDVQVFDATTAAVLGTGATDGAGFFSIPVTDALTRNVRVRMVSLSSSTAGLLIDVRNNASARVAYSVNGPQVNSHAPTDDVDFGATTALPGAGGEAFNIFDVLLNGYDFFALLEGARPNLRVTGYWETTSVDGTYFLSSDNSVRLRGSEGYDDTVIGHEEGHFISSHWSKDNNPGGTHFIGDSHQDLRLSWSEGFATWFAASARRALGIANPRPDLYIDTDGSPGPGNLNFSYTFETPNVPAHGAANEVAVTASLWDTMDDPATADGSPGVDDDPLAHPVADAWEVIRNYLPQPASTNVSLEDFWDGWFRPGFSHGDQAGMESTFAALDVRYSADAGEPDGTPAQAKDITPNGSPLVRTFYPAGDTDFARFTGTVGHAYTVETTDDLSAANTVLTVYAPDQTTVVASNDDRSASDRTSRAAFVASQAGFYYARVQHALDFGFYGSYALRVTDNGTGGSFTDVAATQGVAHAGNYRGVAWGDVDADGKSDLFIANLGGVAVLDRNKGGSFVDRASAWGVVVPVNSEAGAFCDYDKDGDLDLFVSSIGPTALFRNRRADTGDTTFVDATAAAGMARSMNGRSAVWGDADRDGWADLFVCDASGASVLFRNLGNGTFSDVTAAKGLAGLGACWAAAWCDYDHDGDDDLFVVLHDRPCKLMKNRLRETGTYGFDDVTGTAGVPAGVAASSCDWGDFDGDGWMDLYVTDSGGANFLYRNQGDGTFVDQGLDRGVRRNYVTTCGMWADYDNDQDLDLFVGVLTQGGLAGTNQLYENVGDHYTALPALAVSLVTRAAAWGDFDNDLDLDLYLAIGTGGVNQLLRNNTANHHALSVSLLGRTSNRDGFGATVRVLANGRMQYRLVSGGSGFGSQNSIPVEFGLGAATSADSLVVDWPSGKRSVLTTLSSGPYLVDEASAVDAPAPLTSSWKLELSAFAPNPSPGGRTAIGFIVPASASAEAPRVTLTLYSIAGRKVRTLLDGPRAPGPGRTAFDGRDDAGGTLAPGVYLVELTAGASHARGKLVVLPQ